MCWQLYGVYVMYSDGTVMVNQPIYNCVYEVCVVPDCCLLKSLCVINIMTQTFVLES